MKPPRRLRRGSRPSRRWMTHRRVLPGAARRWWDAAAHRLRERARACCLGARLGAPSQSSPSACRWARSRGRLLQQLLVESLAAVALTGAAVRPRPGRRLTADPASPACACRCPCPSSSGIDPDWRVAAHAALLRRSVGRGRSRALLPAWQTVKVVDRAGPGAARGCAACARIPVVGQVAVLGRRPRHGVPASCAT
mgnify:CR=1 FL=1